VAHGRSPRFPQSDPRPTEDQTLEAPAVSAVTAHRHESAPGDRPDRRRKDASALGPPAAREIGTSRLVVGEPRHRSVSPSPPLQDVDGVASNELGSVAVSGELQNVISDDPSDDLDVHRARELKPNFSESAKPHLQLTVPIEPASSLD